MNTIRVTKVHTATVPGVASKTFALNEIIAPSSPFYWVVLWAGYGVDTGNEDVTNAEKAFRPTVVLIGEEDPQVRDGVWIQMYPNGDWTMWIEDGT